MNKIAIPAILVATVMVAGMFAFAPVEQASTVHLSGTTTLAAASGTIVAIDTVDLAFVDLADGDVVIALVDAVNTPDGVSYTASFILSLQDNTDTDGNGNAATVLVEVWDGDQWVDAGVTEPTPADDAEASTLITVHGEATPNGSTIRFTVNEGAGDTEAFIDAQGIIQLR